MKTPLLMAATNPVEEKSPSKHYKSTRNLGRKDGHGTLTAGLDRAMSNFMQRQAEQPVPFSIHIFKYSETTVQEFDVVTSAELTQHVRPFLDNGSVSRAADGKQSVIWLDIRGTPTQQMLTELADVFMIHPVALAAISVNQRVKTHVFQNHQLYITRALIPAEVDENPEALRGDQAFGQVDSEQVCIFTAKNYILTFQERFGDVLEPVRQRIRFGFGPLRKMGPDYLAYSVIDTLMDGYYGVMEDYSDRLSLLEMEILHRPHQILLKRINEIKRDLRFVGQIIWPQRHALKVLIRGDSEFVGETCRPFYRDAFETSVELSGILDGYRDFSSALMHAYLSALGQKTNDIMKLLTLISAIFVPLTFIAGVYGMNFKNMPELDFDDGYYLVLAFMLLVAAGMLFYFFYRGWLWEEYVYSCRKRWGIPNDGPPKVQSRRNSMHRERIEPGRGF